MTPPESSDPETSIDDIRRALAAAFDEAAKHHHEGRLPEAIKLYQQVLKRDPGHASSWINMGVALRTVGQVDAAVASLFRGVALKTDDPGARSNLGNALRAAGRFGEAASHHLAAVDMAPGDGAFEYNLGLVRRDLGELDAALTCFKNAEAKGYEKPDLHWDRALTRLLEGDMARGMADYEWRWQIADAKPRSFTEPVWTGATLKSGALLVYAEQGFGDTLQFFRYLPLLKGKAPRIIFECQAPLARLFRDSPLSEDIEIIARDDDPASIVPMPAFDAQIALLSLPHVLGAADTALPGAMPYLAPPPGSHTVNAPPGQLKIGLTWAGKPTHRNDRNRTTSLQTFMPLLDEPDMTFFSLQLGSPADEIDRLGAGALVHDLRPYLQDFSNTAAVLSQLDLVICVDTSLAHLAGAMARPVWTLLPFTPDWRWRLERTDTPWYPSMRLFRPGSPRDWTDVIGQVKNALADFKKTFAAAQKN
jgi:Flp pilus assembly protein TadD